MYFTRIGSHYHYENCSHTMQKARLLRVRERLQSWLCSWPHVGLGRSYFTTLSLSFLISNIEGMIPVSHDCCEKWDEMCTKQSAWQMIGSQGTAIVFLLFLIIIVKKLLRFKASSATTSVILHRPSSSPKMWAVIPALSAPWHVVRTQVDSTWESALNKNKYRGEDCMSVICYARPSSWYATLY